MRRPGLFDVQVNGYRGHDVNAAAAFLDVDTSADHLVLDGWDVVEVAVDGEVVHRA